MKAGLPRTPGFTRGFAPEALRAAAAHRPPLAAVGSIARGGGGVRNAIVTRSSLRPRNADETTSRFPLVPTLRVGMPSGTLRVPRAGPKAATQSVEEGIPTQSVGTS